MNRNLLSKVLVFAVFLIVGTVMLVGSIKDKVELSKPPIDLETMTEADFKNGRMVEGTLYEMWNEYAEQTQSDTLFGIKVNTKTTGHYFMFPLETSFDDYAVAKIASISISGSSDYATAQQMERESNEAYANEDWSKIVTTMQIKGRISKISGKAKTYFEDGVRVSGFDPAENGVYYVIHVGDHGRKATISLITSIVVISIGVIGGLIALMRGR